MRSPGVSPPARPPPRLSWLHHRLLLLLLPRRFLPLLPPGQAGVGVGVVVAGVVAGAGAVVALGGRRGALRPPPRLSLALRLLEVPPGRLSTTHGQGTSRCGPVRLQEVALVLSASPRPWSPVLLRGLHQLRRHGPQAGLRPLSPARFLRGLLAGTRLLWLCPSAPWG
jgi:hypothetical protein